MKTLFTSIISALVVSGTAFAGVGTLFKGGIGLPDWQFHSSTSVEKTSANRNATPVKQADKRDQSPAKSKRTDHRVTTR
jgi:hypothetical protein